MFDELPGNRLGDYSGMAKQPCKVNPVAISDEERYFVTKELIGPLDANNPVILTRQIKQSLSSPMVDAVKPQIFHKSKKCRRNLSSLKLSQQIKQALPLA